MQTKVLLLLINRCTIWFQCINLYPKKNKRFCLNFSTSSRNYRFSVCIRIPSIFCWSFHYWKDSDNLFYMSCWQTYIPHWGKSCLQLFDFRPLFIFFSTWIIIEIIYHRSYEKNCKDISCGGCFVWSTNFLLCNVMCIPFKIWKM